MKNPPITRKLQHLFEYFLVRLLGAFLFLLPETILYSITRGLARFAWNVLKFRRAVTISNLKQALGNKYSESELSHIGLTAYANIGMTFIEMLLVPKIKNRISEIVDMPNINVIRNCISKRRGIIIVTCHCGSWEITGAAISAAGIPFTVVAARQSNPYIDELITEGRESFGMTVLPLSASAKHLVAAMKSNRAIGLVSDQDSGPNGVFVDFFGQPASTPKGAAQLALKYKAPVVVVVTVRTTPGRYKSIIEEVEYDDNDTVETLTQKYTTVMEDIIRQYPEQYLWMHRRWKTRPFGIEN